MDMKIDKKKIKDILLGIVLGGVIFGGIGVAAVTLTPEFCSWANYK